MTSTTKKALIFANGTLGRGVMVNQALSQAQDALIIAADGGARTAWYYDKPPQVVIGDMDSLSDEECRTLHQQGAMLNSYPREKDETDLELALLHAVEQDARWIRIIGALGGRFDQMLANVYLLVLPALQNRDVAIVAGKQMLRLLRAGSHTVPGKKGDTVSLMPIMNDVTGITTQYLQYPLNDETLHFGPARGISNVLTEDRAHIRIGAGMLLCVHTEGRA